MALGIFFHPKAAKSLGKIPTEIAKRMKEKIGELADDPRLGKILSHSNFWRLRVSDYRIIYEFNEEDERVVILFIGHRSKVYTRFSRLL
ncbi:MAG: type II toxin-antitoxin system RelE family toxin [Promethearchaeota archaeon]